MKVNNICLLIILIIFTSCAANSQKIIIGGKETKRALAWPDFTGNPDKNSPLFAHTYYNIRYKYNNVRFAGDMATIDGFEVTLELDPQKSWAKKDKITDELLVHEQGHFNIGILCMKEILSTVRETSFRKLDYSTRIQDIFTQAMTKYNNLTNQYDEETKHYQDKELQLKWNQYFSEKLEQR